jgi:hypothetical protein
MGILDVLNGMAHGPRGEAATRSSRRRHVQDDDGAPGAACQPDDRYGRGTDDR